VGKFHVKESIWAIQSITSITTHPQPYRRQQKQQTHRRQRVEDLPAGAGHGGLAGVPVGFAV